MLKYICFFVLGIFAFVDARGDSKYSPFLPKPLVLRGGDISNQKESQTMYNKQASNWSRTKPNCLSDFTGRPIVFSMLEPHLQQAKILDVGCGEGYCARKVKEIGADTIIGCDISGAMIQCASSISEQSQDKNSFHYFVSTSTNLLDGLEKERSKTNMIPKEFDVAMAVFLFNYLTTDEMTMTMKQVYQALKDGGYFVLSLIHI